MYCNLKVFEAIKTRNSLQSLLNNFFAAYEYFWNGIIEINKCTHGYVYYKRGQLKTFQNWCTTTNSTWKILLEIHTYVDSRKIQEYKICSLVRNDPVFWNSLEYIYLFCRYLYFPCIFAMWNTFKESIRIIAEKFYLFTG